MSFSLRIFIIQSFLLFLVSPLATAQEKNWSFEAEASALITGGNTEIESYFTQEKASYEWSANKLSLMGNYLYQINEDVEVAKSWLGRLRYDREVNERAGAFLAQTVESDKYRGFEYRYLSDIGASYYFLKELEEGERHYVLGEAGYRYVREDRVKNSQRKDHEDFHVIRSYLEYLRDFSESVWLNVWVEYLPNISDGDDYGVNAELSLGVVLTDIFSMKVGYLGQYDGEPARVGNENYDYRTTLSLLAKF